MIAARSRRPPCCRQVADERAVDLDLVERETAQVAERGIAGAEVVHRNAHAQLAQLVQDRQHRSLSCSSTVSVISSSSRCAGQSRRRSAAGDGAASSGLLNWTGDRLTATRIRGPAAASRHASRSTHWPIGTIRPVSSASRQELPGQQHAALRMVPAQQRLEGADPFGAQVDHRLVEQFELVLRDRAEQVQFEPAARLQVRIHLRREEAECPPPIGLGPVRARGRRASAATSAADPSAGSIAMPTLPPMTTCCPSTRTAR